MVVGWWMVVGASAVLYSACLSTSSQKIDVRSLHLCWVATRYDRIICIFGPRNLLVCPNLLIRLIFTSVLGWAVFHLVSFFLLKILSVQTFFKAECKCCAFFKEAKTQPKTNCSKAKPIDQKRIIGIKRRTLFWHRRSWSTGRGRYAYIYDT